MKSNINERVLLKQTLDEVFEDHSSPSNLLDRLYQNEKDSLPEGFLDKANPREPDDILVIRGTKSRFDRRTWKEDLQLTDEAFHQEDFADPPDGEVSLPEFKDLLSDDHQSIVSHEYGDCPACEGAPEKHCNSCDGDGVVTCEACTGNGTIDCSECGGAGSQDCPGCQGTGKNTCASCDGDGERLVESSCPNCSDGTIRTKETCAQCQGDGTVLKQGEEISCPRCSNGWFSTSGVVAVENVCPECSGRGAIRRRTTCSDCAGSGSLGCNRCESLGTIGCEECGETGAVSCGQCNGQGRCACEDCQDGTIECSLCEGTSEIHSLVVRHTKIAAKPSDVKVGNLPHGISNPDWESIEPLYLEYETKNGATVPVEPESIDLDSIEDGSYVRIDIRYAAIRQVKYDHSERNFRVMEMGGTLYYDRIPERKGLIGRIKGWL
ncbi:hypothetical protein [Halobacterium wangiae]|uniref:hypothetical protein n=1 Tax=Halobacterium wangiae TaxID=2902623 RepID=UPI001E2A6378|nr:hypothetical protein [Halobacterium wangiae]